jgi:hypothetical protein
MCVEVDRLRLILPSAVNSETNRLLSRKESDQNAMCLQPENSKREVEDYWKIERNCLLDWQMETLRRFSYRTENARISDYVLNLTPESLGGCGDAKSALVMLSFSTTNDFFDCNPSVSS